MRFGVENCLHSVTRSVKKQNKVIPSKLFRFMRTSDGTLYSSAVSGEWIKQLHLRLNICISCLGKTPSVKSLIVRDQVLNICCLKGLC